MHDLLITSGVYALTGRQVTVDTVAALLGRAEELLEGRPEIHPADILAEKLPA